MVRRQNIHSPGRNFRIWFVDVTDRPEACAVSQEEHDSKVIENRFRLFEHGFGHGRFHRLDNRRPRIAGAPFIHGHTCLAA